MDYGRSFSYATEDRDWVTKVLLGGLISLIPFVGQFYVMGYVVEIIKNVIAGRDVPLPEIGEDFGGKLLKGLLLSVITFIYSLPIVIVASCSGIGNSILQSAIRDSDTAGGFVALWSICLGGIALILGIAEALIIPFVWAKYAETEQFSDAFKLDEIWNLFQSNVGPTIVVVLIAGLAGFIAALVGSIACLIGAIFTVFYAQLVTAYLYGSLYRQARTGAA
jgi:hypothetical protein